MADYFVGQTNLTIQLDTGVNLTGATCLIKYKKPNRKIGQWSATVNGSDNTKMDYEVVDKYQLDVHGLWNFWAHATFPDSSVGIGSVVSQEIKEEGDL